MKMLKEVILFLLMILAMVCRPARSAAADWPQYGGPSRDGISAETGLAQSWPAEGPKAIWKVAVGEGYSGVSVAGNRLYTMESKGQDEFVICLDATTGKELWRYRTDSNFTNDQGNGPRSQPTVDGELVYTFGAQGVLSALNAANGTKAWQHDLKADVKASIPTWGFAASPLVEGNLLIVPAGGADGNAITAFNKKTGELAWKTQTDEPAYSSPIAITVNGVRQVITFGGTALYSVSPTDGKLFWKYPWKTDWFVNATTPIFLPEDRLFISTAYDHGSAMLRIKASKGVATVEEVWLSKSMKNHFNSSVAHEGYLYGFDNSVLKCVDAKTGEEKWKKSGLGKGSLMYADGTLIVLSERGQLLLVDASPVEYKEKATAQVLDGKCWTMPALAGGRLYLRNQTELVCLKLNS